jgi:hypothetical protein
MTDCAQPRCDAGTSGGGPRRGESGRSEMVLGARLTIGRQRTRAGMRSERERGEWPDSGQASGGRGGDSPA